MEELYNTYYNAFIKAFSQRLKPEYGAIISYYPFDKGCVIMIEVKRGIAYRKEQKAISVNIADALIKTTHFNREKCENLKEKIIAETLIVAPTINNYVILKNNDEVNWSSDAAQNDVEKLYTIITEKYGRK